MGSQAMIEAFKTAPFLWGAWAILATVSITLMFLGDSNHGFAVALVSAAFGWLGFFKWLNAK
jgi:hypothetical protein